jgi:hypothetical protein
MPQSVGRNSFPMFVKSTITRTMIAHRIEMASMASSNPFTCVCFGGKSIWRFVLPLLIKELSLSYTPGWGGGGSSGPAGRRPMRVTWPTS